MKRLKESTILFVPDNPIEELQVNISMGNGDSWQVDFFYSEVEGTHILDEDDVLEIDYIQSAIDIAVPHSQCTTAEGDRATYIAIVSFGGKSYKALIHLK